MARPLALITGGWRRIGAAIATALAADGWDLALHAHHVEAFDEAFAAVQRVSAKKVCAKWMFHGDVAPARGEAVA